MRGIKLNPDFASVHSYEEIKGENNYEQLHIEQTGLSLVKLDFPPGTLNALYKNLKEAYVSPDKCIGILRDAQYYEIERNQVSDEEYYFGKARRSELLIQRENSEEKSDVIFTIKLSKGIDPRSYGFGEIITLSGGYADFSYLFKKPEHEFYNWNVNLKVKYEKGNSNEQKEK